MISDCINLKKPLAHVFTAPSDRIMFFVNDTSSVGSFVNVKNGATSQLQVKVHVSHLRHVQR